MSAAMRVIYFECKECHAVKTVETIGEVVAGPWCDNCRKPMQRRNVEQTMLLSPKELLSARG